jgi:hypothetical protein
MIWFCLDAVGSADLTAWDESLLDNEPQELFVKIKLDPMRVRVTEAVKRNKLLSWNEEFVMYV